jgi:putative ABC transport system ATP-binding protein
MSETILEVKNLSYAYQDGDHRRVIFDQTSVSFEEGHFYSITGESGSGKTTFLYCIGGLDDSYEGEIFFKGKELKKIGLDAYRRNDAAMVYQNFNLISYLNGLQNLYIAADITENRKGIAKKEAYEILEALGIDHARAKQKVSLLSGGEQQRIAIARALVSDAPLIIADEPTGNLDRKNSLQVMEIFQRLAHKRNKCLIMVTHNQELAGRADTKLRINSATARIELAG